jgi:hypothetical protein
MYCKVINCRFSKTHVTLGHKCGKCNKYGHGNIECGDKKLINNLKEFDNMLPLILQCKFGNCKYYNLHTTDAHHCEICFERYHSENTCPFMVQNNIEIVCPLCKKLNVMSTNQQKVFGVSETCVVCMDNSVEVYFPGCGHICICIKCSDMIKKNNNIKNESTLIKENYNIEQIKYYLKPYPSYVIIYEGMGCYSIIRRLDKELEGIFMHSDDYSIINKKEKDFIDGYALINTIIPLQHEWNNNI